MAFLLTKRPNGLRVLTLAFAAFSTASGLKRLFCKRGISPDSAHLSDRAVLPSLKERLLCLKRALLTSEKYLELAEYRSAKAPHRGPEKDPPQLLSRDYLALTRSVSDCLRVVVMLLTW
jgi:hypothetical protein